MCLPPLSLSRFLLRAGLLAALSGPISLGADDPDPTKGPLPLQRAREVRQLGSHGGTIHGVAFLPGGRHALSASGGMDYYGPGKFKLHDCTPRLLDVATGKELRRFTDNPSPVWSVACSPDGRYAASTSGDVLMRGRPFDCLVRLWDVKTGREIRQFKGHGEPVWCCAFSPDGRLLLSGAGNNTSGQPRDCTARLWDVATGKELLRFEGHRDRVYRVAFLPRGKRFLSASGDGTLRLWDVGTGKELRCFKGHRQAVEDLALSPNGLWAASAGWDSTVRIWDIETGKVLQCLRGHQGLAMRVAFAPDGRLLASGGYDQTIRLWDAKTGRALGVISGHRHQIRGLAFAPDGHHLLSGSGDQTVRLWELKEKR
jgi:WD40 repeat protein